MRLVHAAVVVLTATGPAAAGDCRPAPADALPGVRVPPPLGCPPADGRKPATVERFQAGREPGFIDLGGGTTVRVGGRVRMEAGVGRR